MIKRFSSKLTEYYKILELKPGANADEIKAAYNRLVKKYHPDTTLMADKKLATEKFKQVHEARTRLLSPNSEDFEKVEKKSPDQDSREEKEWQSKYNSYEDFKKHFDERERYKEQEKQKREEERKRRQNNEKNNAKGNEWSHSYTETQSEPFQPNFGLAMISIVFATAYVLIVKSSSKSSSRYQNPILASNLQPPSAGLKKSENNAGTLNKPESPKTEEPQSQKTKKPKRKGLGRNYQYLYKGQSGQHKRFTLLSEDDDEHSIFKCNTCSAVVKKENLELHVDYYTKEYQRTKNLKKVNSK